MFCCACAGTCNHVGNHSYCAAHGGSGYSHPVVVGTGTVTYITPPCQHDFVIGAAYAVCNRCEKVLTLPNPLEAALGHDPWNPADEEKG